MSTNKLTLVSIPSSSEAALSILAGKPSIVNISDVNLIPSFAIRPIDETAVSAYKQKIKDKLAIEPILVHVSKNEDGNLVLKVMDGNARFSAYSEIYAKNDKTKEISIIPFLGSETDAIYEMISRTNEKTFSPVHMGDAFNRLKSLGESGYSIAMRLKMNTSTVSLRSRLSKQSEKVRNLVINKEVSQSNIFALLRENEKPEIIEKKAIAIAKSKKARKGNKRTGDEKKILAKSPDAQAKAALFDNLLASVTLDSSQEHGISVNFSKELSSVIRHMKLQEEHRILLKATKGISRSSRNKRTVRNTNIDSDLNINPSTRQPEAIAA